MMRKSTYLLGLLALLGVLLAACSAPASVVVVTATTEPLLPSATPQPIPPTEAPPPYLGTWISGDNRVVILTGSVLYLREEEDAYARETYYDIKEVDPQKRVLKVRISKILVNGEGVGFSTPNYNFIYEVNGDQLRLARSLEETDIPTAVEERAYTRKP